MTHLQASFRSTHPFWVWTQGNQPLVAAAIHDGHDVRPEVAESLALDRSDRRREEDPFTAGWTAIAKTRLVVLRSRFEVDLNRPRSQAVYRDPQDAWGLHVWQQELPEALRSQSLAEYDRFYAELAQVCRSLEQRFGHFVIFDLHTYNHRRQGLQAPAACAIANPEVNLGTGTLNRHIGHPVLIAGWQRCASSTFWGGSSMCARMLSLREDTLPPGFISSFHTRRVLSIEVKKFFMNEWTHQPDPMQLQAVHQALHSIVPGTLAALQQVHSRHVTRR